MNEPRHIRKVNPLDAVVAPAVELEANLKLPYVRVTFDEQVVGADGTALGVVNYLLDDDDAESRLEYRLGDTVWGSIREIRSRYLGLDLKSLDEKLSRLLRWQECVDLVQAFVEARPAGDRDEDELTEQLSRRYDSYFEELRNHLRNDPSAVDVVRMLLLSGTEVLVDLGIRLSGEPTINDALNDDLLTVSGDRRLSRAIRLRAKAYLRGRPARRGAW